jgi:ABC-2 type transport system ATP-binding protein
MDEAERCHRLAYLLNSKLLTVGTVDEVIRHANLTTWEVSGPNLYWLEQQLRGRPGIEQSAAFGNVLHVSGDDPQALQEAIAPFRTGDYQWQQVESGLEDVFIHLMERSQRRAAS